MTFTCEDKILWSSEDDQILLIKIINFELDGRQTQYDLYSKNKSPILFPVRLIHMLTAMRVFSTGIEINQLGIVAANADDMIIQFLPAAMKNASSPT